mgnify:FL=1
MSLIKNNDDNNFYPVSIPEGNWNCDYLFSTHRGCSFDCVYCSSKRLNKRFKSMGDPAVPRRLKGEWLFDKIEETFLLRDLPPGGVFINPYCDTFDLPDEDINFILDNCNRSNVIERPTTCIFQTKNPQRYFEYLYLILQGSWLGTTIETTYTTNEYRDMNFSKAPSPYDRYQAMQKIVKSKYQGKIFITIEPAMEILIPKMIDWMENIQPDLIFIGCDSGKNNLPEPTRDELIELIRRLKQITTVHVKSNCKRILGDWLYSCIDFKG